MNRMHSTRLNCVTYEMALTSDAVIVRFTNIKLFPGIKFPEFRYDANHPEYHDRNKHTPISMSIKAGNQFDIKVHANGKYREDGYHVSITLYKEAMYHAHHPYNTMMIKIPGGDASNLDYEYLADTFNDCMRVWDNEAWQISKFFARHKAKPNGPGIESTWMFGYDDDNYRPIEFNGFGVSIEGRPHSKSYDFIPLKMEDGVVKWDFENCTCGESSDCKHHELLHGNEVEVFGGQSHWDSIKDYYTNVHKHLHPEVEMDSFEAKVLNVLRKNEVIK